MRALLLLGTIGLGLSFSAGGAYAAPGSYQPLTSFSDISQQGQSGDPLAQLIEGRSAFTNDSIHRVAVPERYGVDHTFRNDLAIFIRNVILLGLTSLIFGLGAVGVKALWMLDNTESSP